MPFWGVVYVVYLCPVSFLKEFVYPIISLSIREGGGVRLSFGCLPKGKMLRFCLNLAGLKVES